MVESHLDVGGAVTFWSLADWTDRPRLQAAFAAARAWTPSSPTPGRPRPCLRDALEDVLGGPRVLVRPLASPGRVRRRPRGPGRRPPTPTPPC